MIPRITDLPSLSSYYKRYLKALKNSSFSGDIEESFSSRLLCATDNSVYQCMPQFVIFPKNEDDVQIAISLAYKDVFKKINFTARGGGTGTNGQSLNDGVIIDMSRYMKEVISYDKDKRELEVQVGCIKDELNEFLAQDNLFFSPELSTSNRATIGGMISNDAAGQGSLRYGRTSNHIKAVTVVLRDGSIATFKEKSGKELEDCLKKGSLEGKIYRKMYLLLKNNKEKVKEIFPKLNRFLTGYDLDHAYDETTDTINLARIICGAEGTLGIVTKATLDLTVKPNFRALVIVKYDSFDSALRHANTLINAGCFSVETVDSKVLNLAKKDVIWESVKPYISDVENCSIEGVNIVEFSSMDEEKERKHLLKLFNAINKKAQTHENGILGAQWTDTKEGIAAVYGMRKKAVGLLGSQNSKEKLVAFIEDTVVPPENLADYIKEFRALLDSMSVDYGMFGHVDTGLMHVRPALDLTKKEDKEKLITISNEVVKLVSKYHGQMWGEHGRGYRSVYGKVFFKELYDVAREVKEIFDPDNIFNKGKICTPLHDNEAKLVSIDALMRGELDSTISLYAQESFDTALKCNGNGQCFSYKNSDLMCPSYRYTKDHVRSPKGYSALMREYLRILTYCNIDIEKLENDTLKTSFFPRHLIFRIYNSIFDNKDFNHEYKSKISTCLSCKSCKSQCPAHVNAADLNSRFLSFYYERYLRPSYDLLTLNVEKSLPFLLKYPKFNNFFLKKKFITKLIETVFKFTDVPLFSDKSLYKLAKEQGLEILSYSEALKSDYKVLLVPDAFSSAYESEEVIKEALLLKKLNCKVAILRPYVNGKLYVIRGARAEFMKAAKLQCERLNELNKTKTLVGFDPAMTICYRDEYVFMLKDEVQFKVLLIEEFLNDYLETKEGSEALNNIVSNENNTLNLDNPYYLFTHCTERALIVNSPLLWQHVFKKFSLNAIPVNVACCGMAGLFGHIKENQEQSTKTFEQNWKEYFEKYQFENCLVTGFSCRTQVTRQMGKKAIHPIDVLFNNLK